MVRAAARWNSVGRLEGIQERATARLTEEARKDSLEDGGATRTVATPSFAI
jgi:hypothetical protein